jgi:PAS domain S-box-containing protein
MAATTRLLGEHLEATGCAYAHVTPDGSRFVIHDEWSAGSTSSITGAHRLEQFGARASAAMREGRTFVVRDVAQELDSQDRAAFATVGVQAFIACPLVKDGRPTALMSVFHARARNWTPADVALVEAVVERSWAHIERARAEAALRRSEEITRQVLAAVPVGVVLVDRDRAVRTANERAIDFLGLTVDRLTGMYVADWATTTVREDGSELPVEEYPVSRCLVTGLAQPPMTLGVRRPDGTTRWGVFTAAPSGALSAGVVVTFLDVTGQKQLEHQYQQSQKMEAIGRLAGGVAHDFNNLLTVINGYADMLLEDLPPGDPSLPSVAEIRRAGARSAELTHQLLAFSRRQILAPRVLDLNAVVAEAETMLHRVIGEDVHLTTDLAAGLWAVKADPGQIQQVLMNLAVNARDAMPQGGQLRIETRNLELDEDYSRLHQDAGSGPHVMLSVSDSGSGMAQEVRARLFEPFFTTKAPGKGTGLGLATVYGIVRQSGGHVEVETHLGMGTAIRVCLPVTTEPAAEAVAMRELPARGTETILVVEDEGQVRELLRQILSGCGYTVIEAPDGATATRRAADHPGLIHLLVTDVVMPGMGGRLLAERIRQQRAGVRVLFLSGYTDDAVVRHGVSQEGVNFLQKPFTPAMLTRKVRDVLDGPSPV